MEKSNTNRKPHIVYLGQWGFPKGFASIQRQILISMGLLEHDCRVTVLSFKGIHNSKVSFPPEGTFKGIHYKYTSGSIHRPKGALARNWQKVAGRWNELWYLRKLKKAGDLDVCLLTTRHFMMLFMYWVWLRLNGIPFYLNMDEYNLAIAGRKRQFLIRVYDWFFERYAYRMPDGVLAISTFLEEHIRKQAPGKPILKAPIICDFDEIRKAPRGADDTQLVYCGSPNYVHVVLFMLDAFDRLQLGTRPVSLHLILGGRGEKAVARIREAIAAMDHGDRVVLHRNIPRSELVSRLANATALLIPLRPTLQDQARFPHKMGEYLSSGNAVITTAVGEVNHYPFRDGKNALVADDYDASKIAEKMQFAVDNPEKAREIGRLGREMGLQFFDYRKLGGNIKAFILSGTGAPTNTYSGRKIQQSIAE